VLEVADAGVRALRGDGGLDLSPFAFGSSSLLTTAPLAALLAAPVSKLGLRAKLLRGESESVLPPRVLSALLWRESRRLCAPLLGGVSLRAPTWRRAFTAMATGGAAAGGARSGVSDPLAGYATSNAAGSTPRVGAPSAPTTETSRDPGLDGTTASSSESESIEAVPPSPP
jgi:hypothetical protein